jgi:hypothetical protein
MLQPGVLSAYPVRRLRQNLKAKNCRFSHPFLSFSSPAQHRILFRSPTRLCRWRVKRSSHNNTYYAKTNVIREGVLYELKVHRLLLPEFKEIDHEDGNGLSNQRKNLRTATRSQQEANKPKRKRTSSRFRGVSCWIAFQ